MTNSIKIQPGITVDNLGPVMIKGLGARCQIVTNSFERFSSVTYSITLDRPLTEPIVIGNTPEHLSKVYHLIESGDYLLRGRKNANRPILKIEDGLLSLIAVSYDNPFSINYYRGAEFLYW